MKRSLTEIIGMPVLNEDRHLISHVADVIVDTDRGKVAALAVPRGRVILPEDILHFDEVVGVKDIDELVPLADVIRVKEVINKDIPLYKNRVFTEGGDYLGFVTDFLIDLETLSILKLEVSKQFFIFRYNARIISRKSVLDVKRNMIIVKEPRVRARARAKRELLALES